MDTTQIYSFLRFLRSKTTKKIITSKRKITWFNFPHPSFFIINVATNVANTFLTLIDKYFPKTKSSIEIQLKFSHSYLYNAKLTISKNNNRILQLHRRRESDSKLCNCRQNKNSGPLDGKCLTKCVVYKATVTEIASNKQEKYIGLTENEFKTRLNLQKLSFELEHKRTSTTLSDHVWK